MRVLQYHPVSVVAPRLGLTGKKQVVAQLRAAVNIVKALV